MPPFLVSSVRLGVQEVAGEPVDLFSGTLPITVTLTAETGAVRGTVEECGSATIVLPRVARTRPTEFRSAGPAILSRSMGCLLGQPALRGAAVRATVRSNEVTTVTLKVTARP